jgi:membrane-bound ClpP family serine protease
MTLAITIGLIVLGILFIVIEVFLLPGISIAGIAGVLFTVGGVVYAFTQLGPSAGTITLGATLVMLVFALIGFYRSKTLDRLSLKTEIPSRTDPFKGVKPVPGDKGITLSRLAPAGKILINGQVIEGRCENEMIDENTPVEVVEVGSYNVLVRKINA